LVVSIASEDAAFLEVHQALVKADGEFALSLLGRDLDSSFSDSRVYDMGQPVASSSRLPHVSHLSKLVRPTIEADSSWVLGDSDVNLEVLREIERQEVLLECDGWVPAQQDTPSREFKNEGEQEEEIKELAMSVQAPSNEGDVDTILDDQAFLGLQGQPEHLLLDSAIVVGEEEFVVCYSSLIHMCISLIHPFRL
jgi:hypothetical protein